MLWAQPPAIIPSGISNSASKNPSPSPTGAIARGSKFEISGVRLGGASSKVKVSLAQSPGLPIPLISVTSRLIEAIMPEDAPLGDVMLTVTRDGEASGAVTIQVVRSNLGIFTENKAGWGPAMLTGTHFTRDRPAHPGDTVTFQGTGLGNELHPQVVIGGRPAAAISTKKSAQGVDEVTFRVPANAPDGCFVPLYAKSARWVSNPATIPVTRQGPCVTPSYWPFSPVPAGQTVATVILTRQIFVGPPQSIGDRGFATFFQIGGTQPAVFPMTLLPPPGACIFTQSLFEAETLLNGLPQLMTSAAVNFDMRDAGGMVKLSRPGLERILQTKPGLTGLYNGLLGNSDDARRKRPLFLDEGKISITGEGGGNIGAFSITQDMPPNFTWTNRGAKSVVIRSQGTEFTWNPLRPGHRMMLFAIGVDRTTRNAGTCVCMTAEGATRFTMGSDVLIGFPRVLMEPEAVPAFIGLAEIGPVQQSIRGPGLDGGLAVSIVLQARQVEFK